MENIGGVDKQEMIRLPAVAGSFYPVDKDELSRLIDELLAQAKAITSDGDLKILIVPHAGLEFSGQIAAWGFKQIRGKNYTRVILLGVSHRNWFDYAAIYNGDAWETPLGKVETDRELASGLSGENIIADDTPHKQEHSLEVELIFLQKILRGFKIVPILLGQVSDKAVGNLAQKISQNLGEKTLLVVSSDLSHYPSWADANIVDSQTINAIVSGEAERFDETINNSLAKGYSNLDTCACGADAVKVALRVAKNLGLTDFRKIKYENSGGVSGDKSRVVGYAAIGVWSKETGGGFLDEAAKKEALKIARKTLEEYLNGGKIPEISPLNKALNEPLGVFVTLRNKGQLRGCIGLFEPKEPLYKVIQETAIAAATEDSRFPSVAADELKKISIEISVMTPKRKIDDWKKIELRKHGVVVQKGFRGGTFLPQVATETGWSKEEFLSRLCVQKAGLAPDCYKDPSVNLFVFECLVFGE